jgi:hypothetical protein
VKPEQPNQICVNEDQLLEYLREVVIPQHIVTKSFAARPNVAPMGLNTTKRAVEGYVPRGTLREDAPAFKRIPTQFLADGDSFLNEKSPSTRTTEPSTNSPSDSSESIAFGPGSPQSDGAGSLLSLGSPKNIPIIREALVEDSIVAPEGKSSFFSWWNCGCVPPAATEGKAVN